MKSSRLFIAMLLVLGANQLALADTKEETPSAPQTQSAQPGKAPQMSEIPVMRDQGKRMASMMEKLNDITDPAERKRILAEAMCPQ